MSTIKINHDIPIPPEKVGGRPRKYPFAEMAVGDSFYSDTSLRALRLAWGAVR